MSLARLHPTTYKRLTREFRTRIRQGIWDARQPLSVSINIQTPQGSSGQFDGRPFERDRCLGDMSEFKFGYYGPFDTVAGINVVLEFPKVGFCVFFLCMNAH